MSSLFINRDARIMMLEVAVEKLFAPCTSPFDNVITSKFVVSFRFLDDEWIDIQPRRLDYREYQGSIGEEHYFHGGKSVVFTMTESTLTEETKGLSIQLTARREISTYFETYNGHITNLGCISIGIDDLYNSIVEELRIRDELKDYLRIIHKQDPIWKSTKDTYTLDKDIGSYIKLYVRLSHLGDCVIAEVDKPYRGPISYFYGQEHKNLDMPYEFCELEPPGKPRRDLPFPKPLDRCAVECTCTADQLNPPIKEDVLSQGTEVPKKRKKHRRKFFGGDDCKFNMQKRPTGIITVGIVDKPKPCEPVPSICLPCCPTEICTTKTAAPPCYPFVTCLDSVCCEE